MPAMARCMLLHDLVRPYSYGMHCSKPASASGLLPYRHTEGMHSILFSVCGGVSKLIAA